MFKEEAVLREILCQVLYNNNVIEQKQISVKLQVSIGLVNRIVKRLENIGAAYKTGRKYSIVSFKKILLYWASTRNLQRDIMYSTRVSMPVREIEKSLPDGMIFSAYSAFNYLFNEAPADYSEVWVYSSQEMIPEVTERFPPVKLPGNLYVLRPDMLLHENAVHCSNGKNIVSIPQMYVDLWNIPSWYSKDYITLLERKMLEMKDGILE